MKPWSRRSRSVPIPWSRRITGCAASTISPGPCRTIAQVACGQRRRDRISHRQRVSQPYRYLSAGRSRQANPSGIPARSATEKPAFPFTRSTRCWRCAARGEGAGGPDELIFTVDDWVNVVDRAIELVGEDHVALGSDFDGGPTPPRGMRDVRDLPMVTEAMLRRGYSDADPEIPWRKSAPRFPSSDRKAEISVTEFRSMCGRAIRDRLKTQLSAKIVAWTFSDNSVAKVNDPSQVTRLE